MVRSFADSLYTLSIVFLGLVIIFGSLYIIDWLINWFSAIPSHEVSLKQENWEMTASKNESYACYAPIAGDYLDNYGYLCDYFINCFERCGENTCNRCPDNYSSIIFSDSSVCPTRCLEKQIPTIEGKDCKEEIKSVSIEYTALIFHPDGSMSANVNCMTREEAEKYILERFDDEDVVDIKLDYQKWGCKDKFINSTKTTCSACRDFNTKEEVDCHG